MKAILFVVAFLFIATSVETEGTESGIVNELFENRTRFSGSEFWTSGPLGNSPAEINEPVGAPIDPTTTVWWSWTAPSDGSAFASIDADGFFPEITVWEGVDLASLKLVGSVNGTRSSTSVVFPVVAGREYCFSAAKPVPPFFMQWGPMSDVRLRFFFVQKTGNDDFANALPLSGSDLSFSASLWDGTIEQGEPSNAIYRGEQSLWWKWTSSVRARVTLLSVSNLFNPAIEIYKGDNLTNLTFLAASSFWDTPPAIFDAEPGVEYHFAICSIYTGWSPQALGPVKIALTTEPAAPNDNFATPTVFDGTFGASKSANYFASVEAGEPPLFSGTHTLWWRWAAPVSGTVKLEISGQNNPFSAVYTGDSFSNLVEILPGNFFVPVRSFEAIPGKVYNIQIDGGPATIGLRLTESTLKLISPAEGGVFHEGESVSFQAELGAAETPDSTVRFWVTPITSGASDILVGTASAPSYVFTWTNAPPGSYEAHCEIAEPSGAIRFASTTAFAVRPHNDDFEHRDRLTSLSVTNSNFGASLEPMEPLIPGPYGAAASIWWTWTASVEGELRISASMDGIAVLLAAYKGDSLLDLLSITNRTQDGSLRVNLDAGESVQITAASSSTVQGPIRLSLGFTPRADNDRFASARSLNGAIASDSADNQICTTEPGEPNPMGAASGHSLWWVWEAPFTSSVHLHAESATAGTVIGVYEGDTISTLKEWKAVPYANNFPTVFRAVAGHVYRILVDTAYVGTGLIQLSLEAQPTPSNDDISNATPLSGTFLMIHGTNEFATAEEGELSLPNTGGPNHSLWWSWASPTNGTVQLSWLDGSVSPVLAIYQGNDFASLKLVASNWNNFADPIRFSASENQTYLITAESPMGSLDNPTGDFLLQLALVKAAVVSPTNNSEFLAPANIPLFAEVAHLDGAVVSVEFMVGTNVVGIATNEPMTAIWTNVPSGEYEITAVATDEFAHRTQSSPAHVAVRPPNDNFAARTVIAGNFESLSGSFSGAISESNEPPSPCGGTGRTIWWTWEAPDDGQIILAVGTNSAVIPVISIYEGESLLNLSLIATNSFRFGTRWCGFSCGGRREISADVHAGQTYQIQLDGQPGIVAADFHFYPRPANDDLARAEILSGVFAHQHIQTFGATHEAAEPPLGAEADSKTLWYKWTAPFPGRAIVSIHEPPTALSPSAEPLPNNDGGGTSGVIIIGPNPCGDYFEDPPLIQFSPQIAVFSDLGSDGIKPLGLGTEIFFNAEEGKTYLIAAAGLQATRGEFDLFLLHTAFPPNDNFSNRISVSGDSLQILGHNRGATIESGEQPLSFAPTSVRSVWWSWESIENGTLSLTCVDYLGNPLPVAVFEGKELTQLQLLGAGLGGTALNVAGGKQYQIGVYGMVWGSPGANEYEGPIELSLRCRHPALGANLTSVMNNGTLSLHYDLAGGVGQKFNFEASIDLFNWYPAGSGVIGTNHLSIDTPIYNATPIYFVRTVPVP